MLMVNNATYSIPEIALVVNSFIRLLPVLANINVLHYPIGEKIIFFSGVKGI